MHYLVLPEGEPYSVLAAGSCGSAASNVAATKAAAAATADAAPGSTDAAGMPRSSTRRRTWPFGHTEQCREPVVLTTEKLECVIFVNDTFSILARSVSLARSIPAYTHIRIHASAYVEAYSCTSHLLGTLVLQRITAARRL